MFVLNHVRRRNRKRWRKSPLARNKAEKCCTKWCRNRRALKTNGYFLKFCWKCLSRRLKERHPWTYVLNMIRHSARKRKLDFTLTVESFKNWCIQTGYLHRRGNQPNALTIDRIDWNEGYHIWNLQTLTHEENSEQGADNRTRSERTQPPDPDNEPF